jgi:hypothetical protein
VLLEQIHDFRRGLRALAASEDSGALAELAPYAMIFGLPVPAAVRLATDAEETRRRRSPNVPWSSFARDWQTICGRQLEHSRRTAHGSGRRDFAHQWSAPHDHGHGSDGQGTADMTADTASTAGTAAWAAVTRATEMMPVSG